MDKTKAAKTKTESQFHIGFKYIVSYFRKLTKLKL